MKNRFTFLFLVFSWSLFSQNTFQKFFDAGMSFQSYNACATTDGGFLMAGIITLDPGEQMVLSKLTCTGEIDWIKTYAASSSINNVSPTIINTSDGGYFLAYNTGFYQHYDILATRLDSLGNIIWQKEMNGSRDDIVNDAAETPDGGFILAGGTGSYGQDISGSLTYKDVYLLRMDADGDVKWTRTFGNPQAVDEAWDVVNTSDGNFAVTGRYIHNEAFYILLMKIDDTGQLLLQKVYGGVNHRNYGFEMLEDADGGFAITGMTTLNEEDHLSNPDAFILKTDPEGNVVWAKTYSGSANDLSDIGSAIVHTPSGGYAMAVATMSFPTSGFVPNKHLVVEVDSMGHLTKAFTYSNGGSHYTSIRRDGKDEGYIVSGFSNNNTENFSPSVYKTTDDLESGCNTTDRTNMVFEEDLVFEVSEPIVNIGLGGTLIEQNNAVNTIGWVETLTLCEHIVDSLCLKPIVSSSEEIKSTFTIGSLFPNPATQSVEIFMKADKARELYTTILNQNGIIIRQDKESISPGQHFKLITTSGLSNGLYLIQFKSENQTTYRKLVIQHNDR